MAITAEDRVIAEVKRFCHVGLDETALLGGVAETLRRVIPFDAYCASTTDPASGLMTRTVAEEMGARRKPPSISNMSTSSRTWSAQGGARRALGRVTLQAYRGRARALHVLSGVPPPARAGPHDGRRLRRRWADLGHLGPGTRRGPLRLRSQRSRTAEAPRPARERRAEASRASLTGSSRDRR
jgi:hypothetical protein